MKSVLNKLKVDYTKEPMFFGQDLALQRYDVSKYPIFLKLLDDQMEFFWRPNEVNLIKDRQDFQALSENERFVFTSNLSYQTLMDSVIGRGIGLIDQYVSIPELEACLGWWKAFEILHSRSYTYIIQNVMPQPKQFFDDIVENKEIMSRGFSVTEKYDELIANPKDEKEAIYLALVSTNVLESLRFYISFACGFYFGEQGKMTGNASILRLIARDENVHVSITQNILKILEENEEEGFVDTIKKNKHKAVEMFRMAVQEEKDWAAYLFSKGSLLGLNERVLGGYIEWLAQNRMRSLGLPRIFDVKTNPIGGWLSNWGDSSKVQVAAQEAEILSYRVKASTPDLAEADLGSL